MNDKKLVTSKIWNKVSTYLRINTFVEPYKVESQTYYRDLVLLEFNKDYKDSVSMKLIVNELRDLQYACTEFLANGKSDYKKYTDGKKSEESQNKNVKSISLYKKQTSKSVDVYYLNFSKGDLNIGIPFQKIQFLSFIDSLKLICDETDRFYFKFLQELN